MLRGLLVAFCRWLGRTLNVWKLPGQPSLHLSADRPDVQPASAEPLDPRLLEWDRAEEALRESQRTFATLMSNLPGMVYRGQNDPERTMEFVSEGCLELTGFQPSELIESRTVSVGQLIHPDDRDLVWCHIQAALRGDRPFRLTYRIQTEAGEKWVWEQGRGVFSTEGHLLAVEGFMTDVTERVLAQQMLEQRVADRTRELSALYDVTAVASASLELNVVLDNSLDRVLAAMKTEIGAIHFLDEDGGLLYLATYHGISPDLASSIDPVPVEDGLVGLAVEQGEPLVVPNIAAGLRPLLAMPALETQSYIGVPMHAKGRILGVLSVIGEAGRQFSQGEVSLLASIADQVGVAVENARLYQQTEQFAVMRERQRLARELHDSVAQSLYSLTLLAEAGRRLAEAEDMQRAQDALSRLGEIGQQALKEMRLLVYELRPLALQSEGLITALQQRLDAVERRAGIRAQLLVDGQVTRLAAIEQELYWIVQEALNNSLKHAAASSVTVQIRVQEDGIDIEVVDDGRGFDLATANVKGGMGLVSIRERAENLGGILTIRSAPGQGTRIELRVGHQGRETEVLGSTIVPVAGGIVRCVQ